MTMVVVKDCWGVTDSDVTQYGSVYRPFLVDKTYITENKKWWCAGSGNLSTTQNFQRFIEDQDSPYGFSVKDDDSTEILCVDFENLTVLYIINRIGVQKVPLDVPAVSGSFEEYTLALLDTGMSAVEAMKYIIDNGKVNFVSYPLHVTNFRTKEEYIIDEDGEVERV